MNLRNLFIELNGRISRRPFWLGAIALILLSNLIESVIRPFTGYGIELPPSGELSKTSLDELFHFGSSQVSYVSSALIFAVVSLPLAAKRLHDRGKSAWWAPFFYFGPAALSYGNDASDFFDLIRGVGSLAILFWGIVELGFLRGTPGPNRFGPDPLARTEAQPH